MIANETLVKLFYNMSLTYSLKIVIRIEEVSFEVLWAFFQPPIFLPLLVIVLSILIFFNGLIILII